MTLVVDLVRIQVSLNINGEENCSYDKFKDGFELVFAAKKWGEDLRSDVCV